MRFPSAFVLLLGLVLSPLTMSQSLQPVSGSLEILKASAHIEETREPGRARAFTLVVKNTGERVVKSLAFEFDLLVEDATTETDLVPPRNTCGFILTDVDIQPGDVLTIHRTLSGDHCIPGPSIKQAVRIQEIQYEDGSVWKDSADDASTWKRVKMHRISSAVTEDGPAQKPTP